MKNRSSFGASFISFILVSAFLLLSICMYAEQPKKDLKEVKDSLRSLISNEQSGQANRSTSDEGSEKSEAMQEWFLEHQKAWEKETGNGEVSEGEKGRNIVEKGEKISNNTTGGSVNNSGKSWAYYIIRAIVGFILVIGLLFFVLGGMRFFVQRGTSQYGRVLGKVIGVISLSPRVRVYFLQSGGKVVALGVSGDRVSMLFSMDEDEFFSNLPEVGEREEGRGRTFQRVLDDVEQRIKEKSTGEGTAKLSSGLDDDIASLKANIQKLQEVLREDSEGKEDK